MEFLPNPKQMEYHTGHFLPGSQTKIVLCGTEPGAFRVWIGGSSATENGTGFTLR